MIFLVFLFFSLSLTDHTYGDICNCCVCTMIFFCKEQNLIYHRTEVPNFYAVLWLTGRIIASLSYFWFCFLLSTLFKISEVGWNRLMFFFYFFFFVFDCMIKCWLLCFHFDYPFRQSGGWLSLLYVLVLCLNTNIWWNFRFWFWKLSFVHS